jgi:hypothetical protein
MHVHPLSDIKIGKRFFDHQYDFFGIIDERPFEAGFQVRE